jgi:dihydrofolate reductase
LNPQSESRNLKPIVSIIAAVAENGVIGIHNSLPWRLPADLRRVKALTTGHHIIMGRKNYESLGKPLPNRVNVVVTRNRSYHAPGCTVVHSLADGLTAARGDTEAFIFGGAELYAQALDIADRMYLTLVHAEVPGDTFFPQFDRSKWIETESVRYEADAHHAYPFSFVKLERRVP